MKLKIIFLFFASLATTGCQIPYLLKSGYSQMQLLSSRVPLDKAIDSNDLNSREREKLILAREVIQFAQAELGLVTDKIYTSYVQLDRPFVSYIVTASEKWQIKPYLWWFPITGHIPYKGYFKESDAKELAAELEKENLDTAVRGTSAYSTLGWFDDPILSSMLRGSDYDLVNVLIHELIHVTLYIKSSADFNERLAVFMGMKGAEKFFAKREGAESQALLSAQAELEDEKPFTAFIASEIESLEKWYEQQSEEAKDESKRALRIAEIQSRFKSELEPKLSTDQYKRFPERKLNNAVLAGYKTYVADFSEFERIWVKKGKDFRAFLDLMKTLETSKSPFEDLKNL